MVGGLPQRVGDVHRGATEIMTSFGIVLELVRGQSCVHEVFVCGSLRGRKEEEHEQRIQISRQSWESVVNVLYMFVFPLTSVSELQLNSLMQEATKTMKYIPHRQMSIHNADLTNERASYVHTGGGGWGHCYWLQGEERDVSSARSRSVQSA